MFFQASSRFLFIPASLAFLTWLALWQASSEPAQAQVVRIAHKASACNPALVDAVMEVSSLKDLGKLMSAEVGPMFAQMEQGLRAQGKRLLPEDRHRIFEMMQQAFAADVVELMRRYNEACVANASRRSSQRR